MGSQRLFIALLVPQAVKDLINGVIRESGDLFDKVSGFRSVSPENWHFTITFLGNQKESEFGSIKDALIESVRTIQILKINFESICYGPRGREPRMMWLVVDKATSAKLENIKNIIERNLIKRGVNWQKDNRLFEGHLTIARFLPTNRILLPNIEKTIKLDCELNLVHLMKSTLLRTSAIYESLGDFKFQKS